MNTSYNMIILCIIFHLYVCYVHVLILSYIHIYIHRSVDYSTNIEADSEVVLKKDATWHENTTAVISAIQSHSPSQLKCVVNAAGGWCGGNISDPVIVDQADRMFDMNVRSALSAARKFRYIYIHLYKLCF